MLCLLLLPGPMNIYTLAHRFCVENFEGAPQSGHYTVSPLFTRGSYSNVDLTGAEVIWSLIQEMLAPWI